MRSGVALPAMVAHGLDARVERRVAAEARIDRQRTGDEGRRHRTLGRLNRATERKRRRHLRPVQQCQAFLCRQGQRRQAGDFQRFGRFHPLAFVASLAFAQQHQRHVGQRRQVAGGTDRTFQRNVRVNLGIDQGDQGVDHHPANTGETTAQAVDLEHHDQAHQRIADRLANTGGVGQHQGALQVFQVFAGNAGRGQQAETGVDAVGGAVFREDLFHAGHAGVDLCRSTVVEGHTHRLLIHGTQLGKAQLAWD